MPVPPPVASKQLHTAKTTGDVTSLDRGILAYSPLGTLRVGTAVKFTVTVYDIGRGPQLTSAPIMYHGQTVDPYDVPTSAEVAVQVICTGSLTCQSQTAQTGQPVNPKQEGNWVWSVTASDPGTAVIGIVAVTYQNDSNTFLHATPVWTLPIHIEEPASS